MFRLQRLPNQWSKKYSYTTPSKWEKHKMSNARIIWTLSLHRTPLLNITTASIQEDQSFKVNLGATLKISTMWRTLWAGKPRSAVFQGSFDGLNYRQNGLISSPLPDETNYIQCKKCKSSDVTSEYKVCDFLQ